MAFDATVDTATTNAALAGTARKVAGDLPLLGSIGPAVPSECEDADLIADAVADQIEGLNASEINIFFLETQISFFQSKTIFELIRKVSDKPIWVSFSHVGQIASDPNGFERTLKWFEHNGAEAIGINCAPALAEEYPPLIERLFDIVSVPIIARPGAGLPVKATLGLEFPDSPEHFAEGMEKIAASGATIVGGCCGVTPRHIQLIKHL
jgi:methionine synthase I (cobalamin-dependent)